MRTELIVQSYLNHHHPELVSETPLVTMALAYELGHLGHRDDTFDLAEPASHSELMERAITRMQEEMNLDTIEGLDRLS